MLDLSALSQLKQLKQDIREANPILKGVVKGTSKRFGFVIADGGKEEYLLPQAEMNRLLPGDVITFKLEKSQKTDEKPIAKIEKFVGSSFDIFFGTVKSKNNQLFILPDHKQINRWIFIPPKYRQGLSEGDIVLAKISQHPFKTDGRVQAQVTQRIGQPGDPYIDHRYAIAKHGIQERQWKPEEIEAIRQTAEQCLEETIPTKKDLRDIVFFTIDGTNTQDLDDALSIEILPDGWLLRVAIADVSTFVTENSPLDKIAAAQASTLYMPGQKVSMLPEILASDICSLRSQVDRLALVCNITINSQGEITDTIYDNATIHATGKLGYDDVDKYLKGEADGFSVVINEKLDALAELTKARQSWRQANATLSDEYFDYRYQLDDTGKITQIDKYPRSFAQKVVEECMVAANAATANFLSSNTKSALYLSHNGFKHDQKPGVKKLLTEFFPESANDAIFELAGYLKFLSTLDDTDVELPIQDILRKKMNRSEWTDRATPHFGLGFSAYTTFTSPIRKYSDLLVHRLIKSIITETSISAPEETDLLRLNQANLAIREAQKDCEIALKCEYLKQFQGKPLEGEIAAINHRFVTIVLTDFDLLGQIPVKSISKKAKFKQESLQLVTDDKTFKLKEPLCVAVDTIDKAGRIIRLKIHEEKNTENSPEAV